MIDVTFPTRLAPLSFHQAETIRNMRDYPDCATRYDLAHLCALSGDFDVDVIIGAIHDLVDRHSALRTTVSETTQHVHDVTDYPAMQYPSEEESVDALVRRLASTRRGLNDLLAGAPLFQAQLHTVGDTSLLSLRMHHLVYDGWSLSVLWRDLAELYRARRDRRPPRLPALPVTYVDFVELQRRQWKHRSAEITEYWRSTAANCPHQIAWPQAVPGTQPPDYHVDIAAFSLASATFRNVRAAARAGRVSPFTVLLAVTAMATTRVTGQDDVLIGNDAASREERSTQEMVGLFVNTSLTPVTIHSHQPLPHVVQAIRARWQDTEPFRDAYADQVLAALGRPELLKVDQAVAPGGGQTGLTLPGVKVRPIHVPWNTRYWRNLTVLWRPSGDQPGMEVRFRPRRVGRDTAVAVAEAVTEVLRESFR